MMRQPYDIDRELSRRRIAIQISVAVGMLAGLVALGLMVLGIKG